MGASPACILSCICCAIFACFAPKSRAIPSKASPIIRGSAPASWAVLAAAFRLVWGGCDNIMFAFRQPSIAGFNNATILRNRHTNMGGRVNLPFIQNRQGVRGQGILTDCHARGYVAGIIPRHIRNQQAHHPAPDNTPPPVARL